MRGIQFPQPDCESPHHTENNHQSDKTWKNFSDEEISCARPLRNRSTYPTTIKSEDIGGLTGGGEEFLPEEEDVG
jgi:hypothetical protein